jgi:hypothetical protein
MGGTRALREAATGAGFAINHIDNILLVADNWDVQQLSTGPISSIGITSKTE